MPLSGNLKKEVCGGGAYECWGGVQGGSGKECLVKSQRVSLLEGIEVGPIVGGLESAEEGENRLGMEAYVAGGKRRAGAWFCDDEQRRVQRGTQRSALAGGKIPAHEPVSGELCAEGLKSGERVLGDGKSAT